MFSYKTSEKREVCMESGEVTGNGLTYTHFQFESFNKVEKQTMFGKNWFPMSTCQIWLDHILGRMHSLKGEEIFSRYLVLRCFPSGLSPLHTI